MVNKDRLSKMDGYRVRLRPVARHVAHDGGDLGGLDCTWHVVEAQAAALVLAQEDKTHRFTLPHDHIIEYQTDADRPTDGILLVKSEVVLQEGVVRVEPLHPHPKVEARRPAEVPRPVKALEREPKPPEAKRLGADAEKALLVLASAGSDGFYPPVFYREMEMHNVRARVLLRSLIEEEYIVEHRFEGTLWLAPKGEEYLVKHELLPR